MDIEKLIQIENERHEQAIKTIEACRGLEGFVKFVTDEAIFLNKMSLIAVTMALHEFKKKLGNYIILDYYMNVDNTIAVRYKFGSIRVVVFSYDVKEMLEKVSGGKCRVVEKEYTQQQIICDI